MRSTYIDLGGIGAASSGSHFGGDVDGRANASGQITRVHVGSVPVRYRLTAGGEAEITNLDILDAVDAGADEDVFGFEIPMDDIQPMDVR